MAAEHPGVLLSCYMGAAVASANPLSRTEVVWRFLPISIMFASRLFHHHLVLATVTTEQDCCCRLTEDQARFYAAEVLLAFQYFHSKEIVYRDLKVSFNKP